MGKKYNFEIKEFPFTYTHGGKKFDHIGYVVVIPNALKSEYGTIDATIYIAMKMKMARNYLNQGRTHKVGLINITGV